MTTFRLSSPPCISPHTLLPSNRVPADGPSSCHNPRPLIGVSYRILLPLVVSLLLNWDSADPSRLSVDPREWKMPLPVPSP